MAEKVRTEEQKQARKKFLRDASDAGRELTDQIPEKCYSCDAAKMRVIILAGMIAHGETTLDVASANLTHDTDECQGTVAKKGVYDGRPDCWREQQRGRSGRLMGQRAFTDLNTVPIEYL